MFPSSLQKHINQLDKEISLLEGECVNLETGQKKKSIKNNQSKSNKANYLFNTSPVRDTNICPKYEATKKTKKIVIPCPTGVFSTSSQQSNGSKPWSEATVIKKNNRQRGINTEHHVSCCQANVNKKFHSNSRKNDGSIVCHNCVGEPSAKPGACKSGGDHCDNRNCHVLHKEVMFSKPGGRIEVTVTQIPESGCEKEHLLIKQKNNLKNQFEKEISDCHCKIKGQKWSDILNWDPKKQDGKSKKNYSVLNVSGETYCQSEECGDYLKNMNGTLRNNTEIPTKLSPKTDTVTLSPVRREPEKDCHSYVTNNGLKEPVTNKIISDPVLIFQKLISELQQKPVSDENKKMTQSDSEKVNGTTLPQNVSQTSLKNLSVGETVTLPESVSSKNDLEDSTKLYYENVLREKELLAKELMEKEKMIETMQRREEEYQSVISGLKSNIDKVKQIARDEENLKTELSYMTQKLLEQKKVIDVLKYRHLKGQELLQKTAIENDKLKTRIKIFELEAQKTEVLLAGKDAEIKRYKDEVQKFQKQISEHLASLKYNAQALNVEKMMNVILQQSQFFLSKDFNSVIMDKEKKMEIEEDDSKQNVLVHSSPTSSKYSDLDSSWKRISSIHESDPSVHSNIIIDMYDSAGNEFIHVYGGNSFSDSQSSKNSRKALINKLSDNDLKRKSSSFTSCLSLEGDNDEDDEKMNLQLRNKNNPQFENTDLKPSKALSSKEIQNDIEQLLKNMRLKRTEDIRSTSPENRVMEDLFNSSQISSISVVSENCH